VTLTGNRIDTIFAVASVTKLFTATAILQLVQQGRINLNQTLGTYLDGFPAPIADTVTVHHLLTHTSGMGNYLGDPAYVEQRTSWTSAEQTMDGIMAIVKNESPLLFTPGSAYSYSNSGYATLGAITAHVSGQSYYDYIRQHIFAPANMTRSDFYTRPQRLTNPDIAHPYAAGTKGNPGGPLTDITNQEDFIGSPAGDAFSTAPDMARFAGALTGGRLLAPVWAALMTGGKVPSPPQRLPSQLNMVGYGPQIRIVNDHTVFGHTDGAPGETADIDFYPNEEWVAVILSNCTITNEAGSLIPLRDQLITQHSA
jgi:CubicO group peptidase (beta-lactamase class C family)